MHCFNKSDILILKSSLLRQNRMELNKYVKGSDLVSEVQRIDTNAPNYDQSTYSGRAMHFFEVTNPFTVFLSKKKLFQAKELLEQYK